MKYLLFCVVMKRLSIVNHRSFGEIFSFTFKQQVDCVDLENETGRLSQNGGN